jgi:hypothetical protein
MLGASFGGAGTFARTQETTCTSTSGIGANPCIKASTAVPKWGAGVP